MTHNNMNERMPWRLQIAVMAMQGDFAHQGQPNRTEFASFAQCYLEMADAMLADHPRTAPVEESRAAKIAHIIDSLSSTPPNGFADACKKRTAIEKLVRMLNESNGGGT